MLFYTGGERAASSILQEQGRNMSQPDKFSAVVEMTKLAEELYLSLERNQIDSFGEILHTGWVLKSKLARDITNSAIESNYRLAREAGAEGGKLLGAGSGGFLLLYCRQDKQSQVREALAHLQEMPFAMSNEGSQVIHNDGQNDPILAARPPVLSNK
jgi:D-glycero-alpha-D-manno-heptose-7-phosphate kinase